MIHSHWFICALALHLLIPFATVFAQDNEPHGAKSAIAQKDAGTLPQNSEPLAVQTLLEVKQTISRQVEMDRVRNSPCHVHRLELKKGNSYVIDLISRDFDAFLRLEDMYENELATDDDSGGNLNARIHFTPRQSGPYKIIATTFNSNVGAYQLSVKAHPVPRELAGSLGLDSPLDRVRKMPCESHFVELKKGQAYVFTMRSRELDSYLRLEDPSGKEVARNDDDGGGLDARIVYTPQESGKYTIIATLYRSASGQYSLTVGTTQQNTVANGGRNQYPPFRPAPNFGNHFNPPGGSNPNYNPHQDALEAARDAVRQWEWDLSQRIPGIIRPSTPAPSYRPSTPSYTPSYRPSTPSYTPRPSTPAPWQPRR